MEPGHPQLRNLPSFPGDHKFHLNFGRHNSAGTGLGYDSSLDEYKVVIIEPVASSRVQPPAVVEYRVWIFGLRANSWRSVSIDFRANASARDCGYCFGHFADGSLHWLFGEEANSLQLVAFDVAKETYSISAKPGYKPDNQTLADLHVLNGCLCMSFYNSRPQARLYIRKSDGSRELTWSLLFSATTRELLSVVNPDNFYCGVLQGSCNRILLDLGRERVVLYDFKEKCFQLSSVITLPDRGIAHRARSYVESLVSLHATCKSSGHIVRPVDIDLARFKGSISTQIEVLS